MIVAMDPASCLQTAPLLTAESCSYTEMWLTTPPRLNARLLKTHAEQPGTNHSHAQQQWSTILLFLEKINIFSASILLNGKETQLEMYVLHFNILW